MGKIQKAVCQHKDTGAYFKNWKRPYGFFEIEKCPFIEVCFFALYLAVNFNL